MPNPDLAFYDCCRNSVPPVSTRNADLCSRWLRSQEIEHKHILANADGSLRLNLSGTRIADLSPLVVLPLTHLCLAGCWRIKDFTPLRRMRRLTWLNLKRTGITDLSPLRGLPLAHLSLYWTKVSTLAPLAHSPLCWLDIRFTQVTSLLSCRRMQLEELFFFASRIRRGLDSLRTIGTLKRINRRTAANFWGRRGSRLWLPPR